MNDKKNQLYEVEVYRPVKGEYKNESNVGKGPEEQEERKITKR